MVKGKNILIFLCVCLVSSLVKAQVQVSVEAPSQVLEGHSFRVSYVVNTQDVNDYSIGDFDGFRVVYGPATSQSFSTSIINGKTTQNSSITFTYTLSANQVGDFTLPAMTVVSGGKKYKSETAMVQVIKDVEPAQDDANIPTHQRTQRVGEEITGSDLFVTVTASKKRVYEQEAILLTYKLYTLVTLEGCEAKLPEMDDFFSQEIPLPMQKSLKYEAHNGKLYGTVVWCQYVVYPQKSGKLTIPALPFDIIVLQQDRSIDPFDAFFGGGYSEVRVNKTVNAPAVQLEVLPLPEKPANFSGAVGTGFMLEGSMQPQKLDANDATQLKLKVNGTGNLKLVSAPEVTWPADFESYDAKQTDNYKLTTAGASGTVDFEYTAVPRHAGSYTVPAATFCFFDTDAKAYKTLTTQEFNLEVNEAAAGSKSKYVNREEVEVLNSDIRHIMTGDKGTSYQGVRFFGSMSYLLVYPVCLLVFFILLIIVRSRAKLRGDADRFRGRRAGKAAGKRLKKARQLQKKNMREEFYDEVMRALWGYAADKLSLPVSELNKDNVSGLLAQRGVSENVLEAFSSVLESCEFARFAPGAANITMQQIMDEATVVINKIEAAL